MLNTRAINYENAKEYLENCLTEFSVECKEAIATVSDSSVYDAKCNEPLTAYSDFNVDDVEDRIYYAPTKYKFGDGVSKYMAITYAAEAAYTRDPSWELEARFCNADLNCTETFINLHNKIEDCKYNLLFSLDSDSVANGSAAFNAKPDLINFVIPILLGIKLIDISYDAASYVFNGVKDLFFGASENKIEEEIEMTEKPRAKM